ncbi:transcription antiterminator [Bulleidia sp. zg-1006]|uniref:BglG family transcription antiterminator n=1 Tax=Bulleidia sp. zg-1006 TaxID=2806552 RepID=UPI0019392AF9|nr:PRD domain-containing protein [Bulleidia sp. zg-1006]QRG86489.1 PRD domain-containing protein [Bulleidia sp. zg-1006]
MNKRQEKLLRILSEENKWFTATSLAKLLSVSNRTIRSDIDTINKACPEKLIESNLRKGYSLISDNYKKFQSHFQGINQNGKERNLFILKTVLLSRDSIFIPDLLDRLCISEYTLDAHLKEIRRQLAQYQNLELKKSANHLILLGSENEIRKLYKTLMIEETKQNFLNINELASLYTNFDLLKCKKELEQLLQHYHYSVNANILPSILLHISISIDRILNGKYIESVRDSREIIDTTEYKIAHDFYHRIAVLYQAQVIESEVIILALLLMGESARYLGETQLSKYIPDGLLCSDIINELIAYIDGQHGIDFSKDESFKIGLTIHLQSLIERNLSQRPSTNLYLQEVKRKFPLIFEVGVSSASFLSRRLHIDINEDEIGFITLHLGMAYEHLYHSQKLKAVWISPLAENVYFPQKKKIENIFYEHLEIIKVYAYFQEELIVADHPDFIICSIPLRHHLNIPTVEISLLCSKDDEAKLFETIHSLEKERVKKEFYQKLKGLITKEHFYHHQSFTSPKSVLQFMSDELQKHGYVTPDFFPSVMRREELSPTSFNFNFATPHPIDSSCIKSAISIMLLDKPILWGNYEVQLVFLLAIDKLDTSNLKPFFDWIASLTEDYEKLSQLIASNTYEEFMSYLI